MNRTHRDDGVAVIVPVRDCERYVADAIESILNQTEPAAEIVVVDDGSTDATPTILARYAARDADRVRVIRQDARGQFAAANRGIAESSAPVLAFLDADDCYSSPSLERRLARLRASDRPDVVFGAMEQFVSPELSVEEAARLSYVAGPVPVELFQTMMIRRRAFEQVGPLRTDWSTSANLEWMSRMRACALATGTVPDVVVRRRLHTTNLGISRRAEKKQDLLRLVRAHRRRMEPEARDGSGGSGAGGRPGNAG